MRSLVPCRQQHVGKCSAEVWGVLVDLPRERHAQAELRRWPGAVCWGCALPSKEHQSRDRDWQVTAVQAIIWWVKMWVGHEKPIKRRKLFCMFGLLEMGRVFFPQQSSMLPQLSSRPGPATAYCLKLYSPFWLKRTMKSNLLQSVAINATLIVQ